MITADLLIEVVEQATKEVFAMMLGAEVTREPANGAPLEGGVVSLVGLTGNWSGTGTVSCNPAAAIQIAALMLLLDTSEGNQSVDDEVLDAVAELTNMVIGNIKNLLAERLGEMAISIPTVVYGKNFRFKNVAGMQEHSAVFRWDDFLIEVKIGLAQTLETNSSTRKRLEVPAFSAALTLI